MYSYYANDVDVLLENYFGKDVPLETFGISTATYYAVNHIHNIWTTYDIKKIEDISDLDNIDLLPHISCDEANEAVEVLTSFGAKKAFSIAYIYNSLSRPQNLGERLRRVGKGTRTNALSWRSVSFGPRCVVVLAATSQHPKFCKMESEVDVCASAVRAVKKVPNVYGTGTFKQPGTYSGSLS